jgi:hypothetical protein
MKVHKNSFANFFISGSTLRATLIVGRDHVWTDICFTSPALIAAPDFPQKQKSGRELRSPARNRRTEISFFGLLETAWNALAVR